MDGPRTFAAKRWLPHAGHGSLATAGPHSAIEERCKDLRSSVESATPRLVTFDGMGGEGGGEALRTALTLSLVTGRPFRFIRIRANHDRPGLRLRDLAAVKAAAALGNAAVSGAAVGALDVTFRPETFSPRDLALDLGADGSTARVLQMLSLPIALKSEAPVRLTLSSSIMSRNANSYTFLEATWRAHLAALGARVRLTTPAAGRLDAWIEPAALRPIRLTERGRFVRFSLLTTPSCLALTAEYDGAPPIIFDTVDAWLAYHNAPGAGVVDPRSAGQLMPALALTPGRSEYTVSEVTESLRTIAKLVPTFLDREIRVEEPRAGRPGRVVVD